MESSPDEFGRNFAYYKLVNDENDFVGMIAYTIYKKSKIEYLRQLRKEGKSQKEIDEILKIWQKSQCSENQIKIYRDNGSSFLADFTNELIKDKNSEFEESERKILSETKRMEKQKESLSRREKRLKKLGRSSFFGNVAAGVVSSFVFMFLSIMTYIFLDKGFDLTAKIIEYFK